MEPWDGGVGGGTGGGVGEGVSELPLPLAEAGGGLESDGEPGLFPLSSEPSNITLGSSLVSTSSVSVNREEEASESFSCPFFGLTHLG
jgi:hypothetical protein